MGSSVHSRVVKFVQTHGSHVVARTVVLTTVLTDGTSVVMASSSCTIGHVGGRERRRRSDKGQSSWACPWLHQFHDGIIACRTTAETASTISTTVPRDSRSNGHFWKKKILSVSL